MHAAFILLLPSLIVFISSRYKAFKLIGLQPMSAAIFTLGYALREFGACHYLYKPNNQTPLIVFVLSQVFIYICP